jgi:ubiquitin-protein ligase E3 C
VLSFTDRVEIFHDAIRTDKADRPPSFHRAHHVDIRRNYLVEDAFEKLNRLGPALREHVRVSFISAEGLPEAGVDGGGLFKDLLTNVTKAIFEPRLGLFRMTADGMAYPNPSALLATRGSLEMFAFAGRLLGKALYEEILVELPLAKFFLAKLLGKDTFGSPLNELQFLDPMLFRTLRTLKTVDTTTLDLTFSVAENELGQERIVDLVPGGRDIAVTNENKMRLLLLMADFYVNIQARAQTRAFLTGLSDLIQPKWLRLFSRDEL